MVAVEPETVEPDPDPVFVWPVEFDPVAIDPETELE
jgi:hypothetical protein